MKRWCGFIAACVVLMVGVPAQAQTHPCDAIIMSPGPTLPAGAHTLGTCWSGKDSVGAIITTAPSWNLYYDAVKTSLPAPSVTSANTTGLKFYSWPLLLSLSQTAIPHTYIVEVCLPDGIGGTVCAQALPFVQPSVVSLPPAAPTGTRVQ